MTTEPEADAVVETRLVHDVHRRATSLLADATAAASAAAADVTALRELVVAMLRHHHESEDAGLWPLLTRAAPDLASPLGLLSAEHDVLDAQLDALDAAAPRGRAAAADAAAALRDLVHQHLAHEEPVLFPALRRHVDPADWYAFSERTVATSPPEGTHLMAAFLHEVGTAEELEVIFQHLPPPARELLPAMRAEGRAVLDRLQPARSARGAP